MTDGVFGTRLADATFVVGVVSAQLPDFPCPRGLVLQSISPNTDQIYLRGAAQGDAVVFEGPELRPGSGIGLNITNANQLRAISASADQRLNLFMVRN